MNTQHFPLVSVIVATYNRAEILRETIQSIVNQTYPNLEIIIVGDGCTDQTESNIKNFKDKRIKFFSLPHSGRPAPPRNYGILQSQGEYLAFCDDDDLWVNTKIEQQIRVLMDVSQPGLVYTNYVHFNSLKEWPAAEAVTGPTNFKQQLFQNKIPFSSILIPKKIIDMVGMFDERPVLRASEDYLFVLKIVANYPAYYIDEPLLKYRFHESNISATNGAISKYLKYLRRMWLCLMECYKLNYLDIKNIIKVGFYHLKIVAKIIIYERFQLLKKMMKQLVLMRK